MLLIILVVVVMGLISYRLYRTCNYWTIRGVKQKNVVPLLGHTGTALFKGIPLSQMVIDIYKQFSENRYSGFYQFVLPTFLVRDPELIKQIGVKDFNHFTDYRTLIPKDIDPLWDNILMNSKGDKWRQMRTTLTPFFTSSKMKSMFHLMSECGESFTNYFLKHSKDCENVDMKDVFARYTFDMIVRTTVGVKCDLLEDKNNEFYLMGKEALDIGGLWKSIRLFLSYQNSHIARILKVRMFKENVSIFFKNLISETIKFREEKNIIRPDMLHLLMEARKSKIRINKTTNGKDTESTTVFNNEDIAGIALEFILGGFENISQLMTFMSYELAINSDIQKRLHEEIDDVYKMCSGNITYDALTKMKYLDMVVAETLRKYPNFLTNDRVCSKPYTIAPKTPDEKPIYLEKNTLIWFPVYAIHHDEKYYPEPERFDPERFNDENKSKINTYAYLPFGIGPRNCIGSRFALLETKILLFHILSKFELVVTKKTPIPIKLQKNSITVKPEKSILLTMKSRN